jgi:sarcosine oxidase subunit beta
MASHFDCAIVGGGIIGLSAAYHLAKKGQSVIVIEKGYPGSGSTCRCIGGIRQQFSTEGSIKLMQESVRQFREMEETFGFSVDYFEGGYLFLAHDETRLRTFIEVSKLQKRMGVNVNILSKDECLQLVPGLNTDELYGGAYSPEDGQACPFKIIKGYIQQIKRYGVDLRVYTEVTDLIIENSRIRGVELMNGDKVICDVVLNAAGPWAAEAGKMAGLDLPVYPEEHEALVTDRQQHLFDPMIVDYRSDGCYFNQRVNGQIIGCYTPVPNKPGVETASSLEFLVEMSRRTLRLIPRLKNAKVIRHWGGSYSMTPDGSPIIDKTPVSGFYLAVGMCGHGFMFSPAVGKYISQIVLEDNYPFDWSEFQLNRNFSKQELMK